MPRSPSRDNSDRYTDRRDYFRDGNFVSRLKNLGGIAAVIVTIGWASVETLFHRTASLHSHGQLADPHAIWNEDCAACHQESKVFGSGSIFSAGDRWHSFNCGKCHAGEPHHATVTASGAEFHALCSNCHHEHQGAGHSLTRLLDEHCTQCHADLPAHHVAGKSEFAGTIHGFAVDHPEFASLTRSGDKLRTLRFSHALHMTPGMIHVAGAKGAWTLDRLAELSGNDAASHYRKSGQSGSDPMSLECSSCHQLDFSGRESRSLGLPKSDGAYYQPVDFDAHCRACHPIRSAPTVSGKLVIPGVSLPHGKEFEELKKVLTAEYSHRLIDEKASELTVPPGPGGRFDPKETPAPFAFRDEIERLASEAVSRIQSPAESGQGCSKCHDFNEKKRIVPISTPTIWLNHAKFTHQSHRAVNCADCHPGTGAAYREGSPLIEKEPILIAGIDTCKRCHAPRSTGASRETRGGVRHACTDCHGYHDGDRRMSRNASGRQNNGEPE